MTASETYLEARKILPATIAAHHLEFDSAPTAERIIERLGDDILVEGRPLSSYAQEFLVGALPQLRWSHHFLDSADFPYTGQRPKVPDAEGRQRTRPTSRQPSGRWPARRMPRSSLPKARSKRWPACKPGTSPSA